MAKDGKRVRAITETVDRIRHYPAAEAIKLVKSNARAKFDETIEVAVNLGVYGFLMWRRVKVRSSPLL